MIKGFTLDGSAPEELVHEDAELCHEGRELADLCDAAREEREQRLRDLGLEREFSL